MVGFGNFPCQSQDDLTNTALLPTTPLLRSLKCHFECLHALHATFARNGKELGNDASEKVSGTVSWRGLGRWDDTKAPGRHGEGVKKWKLDGLEQGGME